MNNLSTVQRVHCVGIGGVAVSAIAKLLHQRGLTVSGSDRQATPFTVDVANIGIQVTLQESADHITNDTQLLIYSDAYPPDDVERVAARAKNIPEVNFSEALGWLMGEARAGVAVAGTNGKSTTTALLGLMLEAAGTDPTVVVGSRVPSWSGNVRLGNQKYFVTEADDYRDHFLHLRPTCLVITNIELDHVDYFPNLAAVKKSFAQLVKQTASNGKIIVNLDDSASAGLFKDDSRAVTYSQTTLADLRATAVRQAAGFQAIDVTWHDQALGTWELHLPGSFNVMNVLAAGAAALALGVEPAVITTTIKNFHGIWRRFEILNPESLIQNPTSAVTIVNDYAHHPTAIAGTIAGAKALWPERRLLAVFQPHHHNRLTNLFQDFAGSFDQADQVIISGVYAVAGREEHAVGEKTSQDLVAAINDPRVIYGGTPAETETLIKKLAKPGDLVILMSAGDLWEVGPRLANFYA